MPEKGLRRARVHRSHQRVFDCLFLDGEQEIVKATALGLLLKEGEVVVGDEVMLEYSQQDQSFVITKILPRKNEVYRIIVREQKKKVTAANIDNLAIVMSLSRPKYKRGLLDRYLIRACQWGIAPLVLFNKVDEHKQKNGIDIAFEEERLKELGARCFEVSALKPDLKPQFLKKGYEDFRETIKGKTILFQGHSGVGKSQLISSLTGEEVKLKSQKVGKVGKGTHTTTWIELIQFKDFLLMDAPGVRSFSLEDITKEELLSLYPDLEDLARFCKYNNCSHEETSRECAFFSDVDARSGNKFSEMEKKALLSRLETYQDILQEISKIPTWAKEF